MHSVTSYAIFWLPSGFDFDTPATDTGYPKASDEGYESLVDGFLSDLTDTSYFDIVQQYTDSSGAPGLATSFGGSWVDTSPYPNSEGTFSNPLQDSDIQAEVAKAMAVNGWKADNGDNVFIVFTGLNVYSCATDECFTNGYCSYHSAFGAADGENVVYAYVPDPGSAGASFCMATNVTGLPAPNGAAFADSAVNLVAHELFESVTDPVFNGWYFQDTSHEIADECVWKFGQVASDGADITLNGHRYLVQEMWSNQGGGCLLPPTVQTLPLLADYQVVGGGSGYSPPTVAYWSGGVLRSATLSTTPQTLQVDNGSTWSVNGTLQGSTSTARWQTVQATTEKVASGGTLELTYFHQYLVVFGFQVLDGGSGYSAPSVDVDQFGHPTSVGTGSAVWVDAESSYGYPSQLPGSGSDERWETVTSAAVNGTAGSPGQVTVLYYHEYLVGVSVRDAAGAILLPALIEVEASPTNSTLDVQNSLWADAGSSLKVLKVVWEGTDVAPPGLVVGVGAPQNLTIVALVYNATLRVSDYLRVPVDGAAVSFKLENGTSVSRTTGPGGLVSLASIPLGRFNATVSYLGFSQKAASGTAGARVQVVLPVSLPDVGTVLLFLIVAASLVYFAVRRRRSRW